MGRFDADEFMVADVEDAFCDLDSEVINFFEAGAIAQLPSPNQLTATIKRGLDESPLIPGGSYDCEIIGVYLRQDGTIKVEIIITPDRD